MTPSEAPQGILFDIQAFSVHDGPGCRTTVFFAGCPLRCRWCSNPENFAARPHLLFAQRSCKWDNGCRACSCRCPHGGLEFSDLGPVVHWEVCNKCSSFECTQACASNALRICGRYYDVDQLMRIILRDSNHWGAQGGVTFSGGDPLLQPQFLKAVILRCKEHHIHTAIETSAAVSREVFLDIMPLIDFAFIDVKQMNSKRHLEGTSKDNCLTLGNIAALMASGWKGRLVLRYPVIAQFNDDEDNAAQLADFMLRHGIFELNILKFHRLGQTKWEQLGKSYAYATGGEVSDETMYRLQTLYLDRGILCYVGDKTPF
ncbi:MAG: 4-hydroxyphenylacetate decarboxylase activase [Bacteroidales bacterium]|nr:4-hydroxyphenylacetate decarboxylase activase [Candidatus Colimorpha onthohippi]